MIRTILIFGAISGSIVSALMLGGIALMSALSDGQSPGNAAVGYLTMLLALSVIFLAVKRHRDEALGGVIKFFPALGLGLGVAALAGLFYVVSWEIYINTAGAGWGDVYVEGMIAEIRASELSEDAQAERIAGVQAMMENYANPLFRMPITFLEILPVGVLVALISAALLRNPKLLPKRA